MNKIYYTLLLISLASYPSIFAEKNQTQTAIDFDNDGYDNSVDCNDTDPSIHPGAIEICDGRDNNCDGQIDEGFYIWLYPDLDGDGYGRNGSALWRASCTATNYSLIDGDCDDQDPLIHPGAEEICDGRDNNCDGQVDEGFFAWIYTDFDGDGYGKNGSGIWRATCTATNFSLVDGDCNDSNPDINPAAEEICDGQDNNCDGQVDEGFFTWMYTDLDNDGYGTGSALWRQPCLYTSGLALVDGDCDDSNSEIYPGAPEICDSRDNNCDGQIDEGFFAIMYIDRDGDGYGINGTGILRQLCFLDGYSLADGDCNDGSPDINPAAEEICDGQDNNCDGQVDEGFFRWMYIDFDGDGYGTGSALWRQPCLYPWLASVDGDCDDWNSDIYPGAPEICDGRDNDCDGQIDEGFLVVFYQDLDQDGYGNTNVSWKGSKCFAPAGYVAIPGDCNDINPLIHPNADELCDGLDNNCNGAADEEVAFYLDFDGDGFGSPEYLIVTTPCSALPVYVQNNKDCNDFSKDIHPDADEICDGIDNNCNGEIDEGFSPTIYFIDSDGDGFGSSSMSILSCDPPAGYVMNSDDCDDSDANVNPNSIEACDGIDNNCNGVIDEGFSPVIYFIDNDGDGFGSNALSILSCDPPFGYVTNSNDCDDNDANINPASIEICDGIDNNCNGETDENTLMVLYYQDADSDGFGNATINKYLCKPEIGYVKDNRDCNDYDASINPDAVEICDGIDNNCDGQIDEGFEAIWYLDADSDGFGTETNTINGTWCNIPIGYVLQKGDCDDSNPNINPLAVEICDGLDNDCNGLVDEELFFTTYYRDYDGDTHGDPNNPISACTLPEGYVFNDDDCDDHNALVHYGMPELCDGIDNNCNGLIDESFIVTRYRDFDGDGYGSQSDPPWIGPSCSIPQGYVSNNIDCDDRNATIYPGAQEICDGKDNNCDGRPDDGVAIFLYRDRDGDGYGNEDDYIGGCFTSTPEGYVSDYSDCDDNNSSIHPGAIEICGNGLDEDCDGLIDEAENIIYVNKAKVVSGNGSSWSLAFKELYEAINYANSHPEITAIWVAKGLYKPTPTNNRAMSFTVKRSNLHIIGGFSGTESCSNQPNSLLNPTIVSGDIGVVGEIKDNSIHVITITGITTSKTAVTFENLTIQNGNANQTSNEGNIGAGIISFGNSENNTVILRKVEVRNNYSDEGGAIAALDGIFDIQNSRILFNTTKNNGGSVYVSNSKLNVYKSHFHVNTSKYGGAIYAFNSDININASVFENDSASSEGGGLYLRNTNAMVTNSVFVGNFAKSSGGGIFQENSIVKLIHSTFYRNLGIKDGGAILSSGNSLMKVYNSIFHENQRKYQIAINGSDISLPKISSGDEFKHCILQAGTSIPADDGLFRVSNLRGQDPKFYDPGHPAGLDAAYFTGDDGLQLVTNSPAKNKGNNSLIPATLQFDILGNNRIACGVSDIGAYENSNCSSPSIMVKNSVDSVNSMAVRIVNPFHDEITIDYREVTPSELLIYDINGRLMTKKVLAPLTKQSINTSSWSKGYYKILILNKNKNKTMLTAIRQ